MKRKFLSVIVAVCLFCSVFNVGVSAKFIDSVGDETSGGTAGKVYCRMTAYATYQSVEQTGTEGTYYETTARITTSKDLLADSWTVTGVFNTAHTSTRKNASASKANLCSISSFMSGGDEYISGQFNAGERSTAFGNRDLKLNVVY